MKHAINAALISLLVFSGTSLSQEKNSEATLDTITSYYHSLAKTIQTSLAYPFTALNIGSFDLEDENVSKTFGYKKCIHVIRSYLLDAKRTAFKLNKYFKTEDGKRTLYKAALVSIVMAGGYKIWLQNQQLAKLSRKIARNEQRAVKIEQDLKIDIARLNAGLAQANRNNATVAREVRDARRAVQELAVQVRAPNSAQIAALQIKDGAVNATEGLFMFLVMMAVRTGLV